MRAQQRLLHRLVGVGLRAEQRHAQPAEDRVVGAGTRGECVAVMARVDQLHDRVGARHVLANACISPPTCALPPFRDRLSAKSPNPAKSSRARSSLVPIADPTPDLDESTATLARYLATHCG